MAGTEYEFPAAGIDAGRYVTVLAGRAAGDRQPAGHARVHAHQRRLERQLPSTMVAEGPAVKMFERLQHEMIEDDLELMRPGVGDMPWRRAVCRPRRWPTWTSAASPPTLAVRDRLRDAQADQILLRAGAMSVETMAMRHGLDPDRE